MDPSNGLPTVEVSDIPVRMHSIIVEMQKTPLILDTTKEQVARTFYAYKGNTHPFSPQLMYLKIRVVVEVLPIQHTLSPHFYLSLHFIIPAAHHRHQGICEDVSSLVVPFGKSGVKRQDVVERLRKSLVGAMKSGMVFALYLGRKSLDLSRCRCTLLFSQINPSLYFTCMYSYTHMTHPLTCPVITLCI